MAGTIVIARLNDRAQPVDRGELYEDPLQELLAANAWGEVSGGGSQLSEQGEIQFCDIEILPDSTYQECDSNFVYSEFNRLLSGIGRVHSHWQGPTETALYVLGRSAGDMRAALQPFLDSYPLCQRARVVQIAWPFR